MLSLIVPIYKNAENIPSLLEAIRGIAAQTDAFEAVFVVDGSPDQSWAILRDSLPDAGFEAQLLGLSRNFGAFAAIRAGLEAGQGDVFAVMAADLQEPPSLIVEMSKAVAAGSCDVAYGERVKREDPIMSRMFSAAFWGMYRRVVSPDIPAGGVDIFACSRAVRDQLLNLNERNSSLVGLLFWVGFRRQGFPYERAQREIGVSAWTFAKKWKYMQDSIFSFSDLPISFLLGFGFLGLIVSTIFGLIVTVSALFGQIDVPGYAATIIVVLFFGMLQMLGMGILGIYVWRVFENTKERPSYIVISSEGFLTGDPHQQEAKTLSKGKA